MAAEVLHSPCGAFRLPLPPSGTNDGYRLILHGRRPALRKSDELVAWESRVAEVLAGWRPPERTALAVAIGVSRDQVRDWETGRRQTWRGREEEVERALGSGGEVQP